MDTDGSVLDSTKKLVCSSCIGDKILSAEIHANGSVGKCAFCGQMGPTVWISGIACEVMNLYIRYVDTWEPNQNGNINQHGLTAASVVGKMLKCNIEIGMAIFDQLRIIDAGEYEQFSQGIRLFDPNGLYRLHITFCDIEDLHWRWFCEYLETGSEFLRDFVSDRLERIFSDLPVSSVVDIDPKRDGIVLYRGRPAPNRSSLATILANPAGEFGPPLPTGANRAG